VDEIVHATSSPGIEFAVGEDDVGVRKVVFRVVVRWVGTSERSQSPGVIGSEAIGFLALFGVGIVIKRLFDEHGVRSHCGGHGQLVASEDVPSGTI